MKATTTQNASAVLFFLGAIFCFSFMDATARGLSFDLPVLQLVWGRYSFQLLFSLVLLAPRLHHIFRSQSVRLHIIRSLLLFGATISFFFGLSNIPLADITAVFEIAPLIITILAVFILGERIRFLRIVAVIIGLIGALIVIEPSSDAFRPAALFGVAAAVCYATYTVLTRLLSNTENPWTSFVYTALIGTILINLVVPWVWVQPSLWEWCGLATLGTAGMIGHYMLIRALSIGEASFLAPFGYVGLLYSGAWGFLLYHEIPSMPVFIGSTLIIGAGLFVWWRETHHN